MNLAKMNEATAKAQYEAIYLSINNDKNDDEWTKDEIQMLKKDAITELYENIMEISGVNTTEKDIKSFPEN